MHYPFRILSSDLLIADVMAELKGNNELVLLAEEWKLKAGDKLAISKAQLDQLTQAVQGRVLSEFPGGSSANVLTTLSRLAGEAVQVEFIGTVGTDRYSRMIADDMQQANIQMIAPYLPHGTIPEVAITHVIKYPGGERTTATWPGNAHELITPEMVTDKLVTATDALLVQGSLWEKFNPEFASRLLEYRRKHNKALWLALPTRAGFGVKRKDMFQRIIPGANLVLANIAELARVAGIISAHVPEEEIQEEQKQDALRQLQQALTDYKNQAGFITDGRHGAWVITAHEMKHVDTVNKTDIHNTVGAGDTAYAGFLYGYLKGLPHAHSAQIGMALAGEKLKHDGARLPDPKAVLEQTVPNLS